MFRNFLLTTVRTFTKNTGYFLLGTLGLSLSLACVISLFTIVTFQNSFDQHQEDRDRLFRLIGLYKRGDVEQFTATVPHLLAEGIKNELPQLEAISNTHMLSEQINIPLPNGSLKKLKQRNIGFVQPGIFDILKIEWTAGSFNNVDPKSIYISEKSAKRFFATSDFESVIGREVILANEHNLLVEGVYKDFPKTTDFPFEVMTAYSNQKGVNTYYNDKDWNNLNGGTQCIIKLKENINPEHAENSIQKVFASINTIKGYELHLQPFSKIHEETTQNYSGIAMEKKYTYVSYTLAAILALIGSINFVNLSTARSIKRLKEIGIRKVIGGSQKSLIIQFLFESMSITLCSLLVGFFIASIFLSMFNSLIAISNITIHLSDIPLSQWFTFSLATLVIVTLASGLYPAIAQSRMGSLEAMKIKLNNVDRQSRFPVRKLLIGVQFGFSVILVVSALIILGQLRFMKNYDLGFHSDGVISMSFPKADFEKQQILKSRLEQVPGIQKVSLHLGSPIARTDNTNDYFNPDEGEDQSVKVNSKAVDEDYLKLFNIELLSGRNLTPNDTRKQVLINELGLKRFKLGTAEEAIGKELKTSFETVTVVGVVEDFNSSSLSQEIVPVFLYYQKEKFFELAVLVDDPQKTASILTAINNTWDEIYPNLLIEYDFLDDLIIRRYTFVDIIGKSTSFFVLIAIIISGLGLFGLTNYLANAKKKEIGIRKVIGAKVNQVLQLIVKEIVLILTISFFVAWPIAYFFMDLWLQDFAYRINVGIEVVLLSLLITMAIVFISIGYRSWTAARINPVIVLKDE